MWQMLQIKYKNQNSEPAVSSLSRSQKNSN